MRVSCGYVLPRGNGLDETTFMMDLEESGLWAPWIN